ncbi:hypothetical protein BFG51_05220 [Dietzia alimentaria]|nr:hypothetical protein BFG51_05220 [Dietzia alimentaria]
MTWADGLITVNADLGSMTEIVSAYRGAGGRGPLALQVHISIADTLGRARDLARASGRTTPSARPSTRTWPPRRSSTSPGGTSPMRSSPKR